MKENCYDCKFNNEIKSILTNKIACKKGEDMHFRRAKRGCEAGLFRPRLSVKIKEFINESIRQKGKR
jgi:hypothetical protein